MHKRFNETFLYLKDIDSPLCIIHTVNFKHKLSKFVPEYLKQIFLSKIREIKAITYFQMNFILNLGEFLTF